MLIETLELEYAHLVHMLANGVRLTDADRERLAYLRDELRHVSKEER